MKFHLKNIGLFKEANFDLNGITVIAGPNSTGKSTIEKAVSLYMSSLYRLDDYILFDRVETIKQKMRDRGTALDTIFKTISHSKRRRHVADIQKLQDQYSLDFAQAADEELSNLLEEYALNHAAYYGIHDKSAIESSLQYKSWEKITLNAIKEILRVNDADLGKTKVTQDLRLFFASQIITIGNEEEGAQIRCREDNSENIIEFSRNMKSGRDVCSSIDVKTPVVTDAVYIDSPNILDNLIFFGKESSKRLVKALFWPGRSSWWRLSEENNEENEKKKSEDTLVQQEQTAERIDRFHHIIENIVGGHLEMMNTGRLQFVPIKSKRNIEMANVSTGIKALSTLAYIIDQNILSDDMVLMLDEPEINLHPEWQLKYAEILVELQKEYNLKIILTTHSPYFVEAIENYSRLSDNNLNTCHFYLTEHNGNSAVLKDVTEDPREIYKKMAEPFAELEKLEEQND